MVVVLVVMPLTRQVVVVLVVTQVMAVIKETYRQQAAVPLLVVDTTQVHMVLVQVVV